MTIRKRLIEQTSTTTPLDWLAVQDVARIELTSEEHGHSIESALTPDDGNGWRASEPGEQVIRMIFDHPRAIRLIHLVFEDAYQERAQEFTVRWSSDGGVTYATIVRQQFFFSPTGATREVEDYTVDLSGVTAVELHIVPDLSGRPVVANLRELRIR